MFVKRTIITIAAAIAAVTLAHAQIYPARNRASIIFNKPRFTRTSRTRTRPQGFPVRDCLVSENFFLE